MLHLIPPPVTREILCWVLSSTSSIYASFQSYTNKKPWCPCFARTRALSTPVSFVGALTILMVHLNEPLSCRRNWLPCYCKTASWMNKTSFHFAFLTLLGTVLYCYHRIHQVTESHLRLDSPLNQMLITVPSGLKHMNFFCKNVRAICAGMKLFFIFR